MSGERGETIDMAYIGRALQRLTTEVASLRDDMRVLTTIVLRRDNTLARLDETMRDILPRITAMVRTVDRICDRGN